MSKNKSSISKVGSYKNIAEFWDSHDLADYWDRIEPAEFEVDIRSEITYYALDRKLSELIRDIARERGISPDTLLNLWIQEKLQETKASL